MRKPSVTGRGEGHEARQAILEATSGFARARPYEVLAGGSLYPLGPKAVQVSGRARAGG
jgi:hypothetical protein